jgi:hypothetical protein
MGSWCSCSGDPSAAAWDHLLVLSGVVFWAARAASDGRFGPAMDVKALEITGDPEALLTALAKLERAGLLPLPSRPHHIEDLAVRIGCRPTGCADPRPARHGTDTTPSRRRVRRTRTRAAGSPGECPLLDADRPLRSDTGRERARGLDFGAPAGWRRWPGWSVDPAARAAGDRSAAAEEIGRRLAGRVPPGPSCLALRGQSTRIYEASTTGTPACSRPGRAADVPRRAPPSGCSAVTAVALSGARRGSPLPRVYVTWQGVARRCLSALGCTGLWGRRRAAATLRSTGGVANGRGCSDDVPTSYRRRKRSGVLPVATFPVVLSVLPRLLLSAMVCGMLGLSFDQRRAAWRGRRPSRRQRRRSGDPPVVASRRRAAQLTRLVP